MNDDLIRAYLKRSLKTLICSRTRMINELIREEYALIRELKLIEITGRDAITGTPRILKADAGEI